MKKYFFTFLFIPILSGCTLVTDQIQGAGNYLAEQIGLIEPEKSYSSDEQLSNSTSVITLEQEYYIGRAVAAQILERFKPLNNEQLQKYVRSVGLTLANSTESKATFSGYHFLIIESEQLNAISAPGGFIFLTTGFLKKLESEDQLASVLAHEIAHVSLQHGIKVVKESSDYKDLVALGLSAGSLNCVEALSQATLIFSQFVDKMVDTLLESGYSQEFEFEADAMATRVMSAAGYQAPTILAALDIIRETEQKSASRGGWFDTHPSVDDRVAQLNQLGIIAVNGDISSYQSFRKDRFLKAISGAVQ
jgi:beta-barrel assembly-enhancing protease